MDRQFILNIYSDLINKKKKIKGVELGLNFLELFSSNLMELESKSKGLSTEDLNFYFFNKNSELKIKVDKIVFQHHFQFFYRDFIEDYYLMTFPWYQKMYKIIFDTLKHQLNFDSTRAIKYIIRLVYTSFVIYSNGKNEYDYNKVVDHLNKLFIQIGFSPTESSNFSRQIINGLEIYEIIFMKRNILGNIVHFSLSDPYMDIVFFINTLFVALVYEDGVKYNPYIGLLNLSDTISFFDKKWNEKINGLYPLEVTKIESIFDFYNLESKADFMEFAPSNIKKLDLILYFNNILLNEYCFHTIIMSCFEYYCLRLSLKNVLLLYKNYDYHLNP